MRRRSWAPALAALCAICGSSSGARARGEQPWSEPVNGLKGRFVIDGAICDTKGYVVVFVQLRNVGDVALSVEVGNPFALRPRLINAEGRELDPTTRRPDLRFTSSWLTIEPARDLVFLASARSVDRAAGPQIDLVTRAWRVAPPGATQYGDYLLRGTYDGSTFARGKRPESSWAGKLKLPAMRIRVFAAGPNSLSPNEGNAILSLARGHGLSQWLSPGNDKDNKTVLRIIGPDGVVARTFKGWRFFLVRTGIDHGPDNRLFVGVAGLARSPRRSEFLRDLTGDDVPEICLMEWTGGAHASFTYWILSLGDELTLLRELPLGNGQLRLADLDGDGTCELITRDDVFAYVYGSYAGSPFPPLVFAWQDNRYVLATDRHFHSLEKARPGFLGRCNGDEMRPGVKRLLGKGWPDWLDAARDSGRPATYGGSPPFMAFLRVILGKYYCGKPGEAFAFLDRMWPDDVPGKAAYVERLKRELARSRLRGDVQGMFKRLGLRNPWRPKAGEQRTPGPPAAN